MSTKKNDKGVSKGFFAVLKSQPQTLAEAKLKTKYFLIVMTTVSLIISALFALVHIVLGLFVAVVYVIVLIYVCFIENQKNKRNFCSQCGAKIDYEKCVAWDVVKYDEKSYNINPNKSGRQVTGRRIATVQFTCTCIECGNVNEFKQKYDTLIEYSDGTLKENKIEPLIKNYFKL